MDAPTPRKHSREFLQQLIDSGVPETAQRLIDDNKYPYKINGKELVEAGESTGAWLDQFVTVNPEMIAMKSDVRKLAIIDECVLIVGDTGTGKEIIAHALHGDKTSTSGNFIAINCAAIPENLIESELFGHEKGAFTGADVTKIGLLKAAKFGTVFLDEIGELPIQTQAKLLRAIQEKEIRKVGSTKDEPINCRIVCATHRDIEVMADKNEFRLDLYARLSTFEIDLLPLSLRREDIVPILKSISKGGNEFVEAMLQKNEKFYAHEDFNIKLNVRSLQKYVARYKVLGHLPELKP